MRDLDGEIVDGLLELADDASDLVSKLRADKKELTQALRECLNNGCPAYGCGFRRGLRAVHLPQCCMLKLLERMEGRTLGLNMEPVEEVEP